MREEDSLVNLLQRAKVDLEEIKTKQFAGADNLRVITNDSGQPYDTSVVVADGILQSVVMTFDADNQDYPFVDPVFYIYQDSVEPANLVHKVGKFFANEDSITELHEHVSDSNNPKRIQWTIRFLNFTGSTHTYYIKAIVRSADTGTIS